MKKKKLLVMGLVLSMVLSVCGCGSAASDESGASTEQAADTTDAGEPEAAQSTEEGTQESAGEAQEASTAVIYQNICQKGHS